LVSNFFFALLVNFIKNDQVSRKRAEKNNLAASMCYVDEQGGVYENLAGQSKLKGLFLASIKKI
jgi:hypothetical protein